MYRCRDHAGRLWQVDEEAVRKDYAHMLEQDEGISKEEATAKTYEDESWKDYWFEEQILPFPKMVMVLGEMIEDISEERKQEIIDIYAERYMEQIDG